MAMSSYAHKSFLRESLATHFRLRIASPELHNLLVLSTKEEYLQIKKTLFAEVLSLFHKIVQSLDFAPSYPSSKGSYAWRLGFSHLFSGESIHYFIL